MLNGELSTVHIFGMVSSIRYQVTGNILNGSLLIKLSQFFSISSKYLQKMAIICNSISVENGVIVNFIFKLVRP